MPIFLVGIGSVGRRRSNPERPDAYVLDWFPERSIPSEISGGHVEAETLPDALRKLADEIETVTKSDRADPEKKV